MSLAARAALGLPADPWGSAWVDTADAQRVRQGVEAALAGELVSVVGPWGAGKTRAARRALAGRTVAQPLRLDRERLTLPDVLTAVVTQLSGETPRHSAEARAAQARRLLSGRRAVVAVDDAHELHGQTVRGLRRLREMPWDGDGPLCGVLLLGVRDRTEAAPDVGMRTVRVRLGGLAAAEAAAGLSRALGARMDAACRAALAEAAAGGTWLGLRTAAEMAIDAAAARGADVVELRDATDPAHLADREAGRHTPIGVDTVDAALTARRMAA